MTVGPVYGGADSRAQMRAADTDRNRVVDILSAAFTEGRLSKDEYDLRMGAALSAATYADLDRVVADIPVPRPFTRVPGRANSLAIASLICGLGQFLLGPLSAIPAVVLGHMARRQIRRTGEEGSGMALAGLIMGWIGIALTVLAVVGGVLAFVTLTRSSGVQVHPPPGG